jgi:hypothetical protein
VPCVSVARYRDPFVEKQSGRGEQRDCRSRTSALPFRSTLGVFGSEPKELGMKQGVTKRRLIVRITKA